MDYILLSIAIIGLGGLLAVLALVAKLYLDRRREGADPIEGELRQRETALEQEVADLRAQQEKERELRVQAETRLEAQQANLAEQRRLLGEAETKLKDTFKALSAETLKESREQFLGSAKERLEPIQKMLDKYQKRLEEIEKARNDAYGGLKQRLENLVQVQQTLEKETHQLQTALRSPTVRGRWGEVQLRRVCELAGMSRYCDFDEQAVGGGESGRLRPDMIVRLPNDRIIVVDSKASLDAYLEAMEAPDQRAREAALVRHAKAVRSRMRELGQKAYADHLDTSPDFVVLFLPGESFFSAALEQDRNLMEDGMKSGVILATPTTLIALLKAVAYGWRQQEMAENARRIADAGRELYDRVCIFAEHLQGVGGGLRRASDAYNKAVGSYESRLVPGARQLAEMGADTDRDLPAGDRADGHVRTLTPPETPEGEPGDEPQEE